MPLTMSLQACLLVNHPRPTPHILPLCKLNLASLYLGISCKLDLLGFVALMTRCTKGWFWQSQGPPSPTAYISFGSRVIGSATWHEPSLSCVLSLSPPSWLDLLEFASCLVWVVAGAIALFVLVMPAIISLRIAYLTCMCCLKANILRSSSIL